MKPFPSGRRLFGPRGSLRSREALTGLASMVPALLLVGVVIWYPVIQTFRYSFTEWNGASATWVGRDNYRTSCEISDFWTPLKQQRDLSSWPFPAFFSFLLSLPFFSFEQVPRLAVLSRRSITCRQFSPRPSSACSCGRCSTRAAWSTACSRPIGTGVADAKLARLGSDRVRRPDLRLLLADTRAGRADLSGRFELDSGEVIEASQLDGASWWQRLRQIIVPLLVPTVAYFTIVNAIWAFVGVFAWSTRSRGRTRLWHHAS